MTSLPLDAVSLLDLVLIVALLATAAYAVGLRREFRRFRAYNEEYAAVLAQTGRAMEGVERAVDSVQTEGARVLAALGERIEEAREVVSRLETVRAAAPGAAAAAEEPAPEAIAPPAPQETPAPEATPAPFQPRSDQKPKPYSWPTVVVKRLPDEA
ncbi:hypothetical protein [Salinarimonas sp.]|uniref:hypothetical protein n=1 Tax=Salinarimonas sp. TaxID=2766526 RepID=UPI0032D98825